MDKLLDKIQNDFLDWGVLYELDDLILNIKTQLCNNDILRSNSRIIFSVCSDDINRLKERKTIESYIKKEYNGEFHLGSLGAYPIGGLARITAANHHPPNNTRNKKKLMEI